MTRTMFRTTDPAELEHDEPRAVLADRENRSVDVDGAAGTLPNPMEA